MNLKKFKMADPRWRIQDGGSKMADTKMTIVSLIWALSAKFHVFQMPFMPKNIFTPSGTVFSKFIALEFLSETLRNKWCHNDVIWRHSDITVSVVVRISAYTILCKLSGHSVSSLKVHRGGFWSPPLVPEGRKKPVWIGLNPWYKNAYSPYCSPNTSYGTSMDNLSKCQDISALLEFTFFILITWMFKKV